MDASFAAGFGSSTDTRSNIQNDESFGTSFEKETPFRAGFDDISDVLTSSFKSGESFKARLDAPVRGDSGTKDYNELYNKPQIEHRELVGNKSFDELGLSRMSNMDIEELINSFT